MVMAKFEVVEKDEEKQDTILSTLVEQPTQGIAYMCLRSGEPKSADDIIQSLSLSDTWFTEKFNQAVTELSAKGLIQEVAGE